MLIVLMCVHERRKVELEAVKKNLNSSWNLNLITTTRLRIALVTEGNPPFYPSALVPRARPRACPRTTEGAAWIRTARFGRRHGCGRGRGRRGLWRRGCRRGCRRGQRGRRRPRQARAHRAVRTPSSRLHERRERVDVIGPEPKRQFAELPLRAAALRTHFSART